MNYYMICIIKKVV